MLLLQAQRRFSLGLPVLWKKANPLSSWVYAGAGDQEGKAAQKANPAILESSVKQMLCNVRLL